MTEPEQTPSQQLERAILGDEVVYNALEVAARTGATIEQAQRLYVTLRRRGVPVEMLLFPGEGHELSRSGLPSHRVARFEAILDWFQRYL